MTEESGEPGYEEPPEGFDELIEEVRQAVELRLDNETFAEAFRITSTEIKGEGLKPVPFYAIAARQPISLEKLHELDEPISWGFEFLVDTEDGEKSLLAATGPAGGGGFSYSSILDLPEELFPARMAQAFAAEGQASKIAVLQVPTYYLEALWVRTDDPETDALLFIKNGFGLFPPPIPPFETVPLADLVAYINANLSYSDGVRPRTDTEGGDSAKGYESAD